MKKADMLPPGASDWRKNETDVYAGFLAASWAFKSGMIEHKDREVARAACRSILHKEYSGPDSTWACQIIESAWDSWNSGTMSR